MTRWRLEEERVSRGSGIDDDKPVLTLIDNAGERAEDRDLFCARAAQILLEKRSSWGVEVGAGYSQNLIGVRARLGGRINTGHANTVDRRTERGFDVSRRVGSGEMDLVPAARRNLSTRMRQRWVEFSEPPRRRSTPAWVG